MADTTTPPDQDNDPAPGNTNLPEAPLKGKEKFWIGFLLIFFICLSLLTIIAYWPDRMPCGKSNTYRNTLFSISLLDNNCSPPDVKTDVKVTGNGTPSNPGDNKGKPGSISQGGPPSSPTSNTDQVKDKSKPGNDPVALADTSKKDTTKKAPGKEPAENKTGQTLEKTGTPTYAGSTIHLSTLLMILVAAAGFLGNMVHISSSLTTFIGSGQFRRSWILWYFTKPFTASGLAIFLYFAMNGGSSSFTSPGTTVNLYVIMTTATLAGLFTDIATQKLKEVFAAIFKPSDNRPDKLVPSAMTFDLANIHPDKISVSTPNTVMIPGQNLDPNNLVIKINNAAISGAVITPTLIKFSYTVAATDTALTTFALQVTDKTGKDLADKTWLAGT